MITARSSARPSSRSLLPLRVTVLVATAALIALAAAAGSPSIAANRAHGDGSGGRAVAHRAGAKVVRSPAVRRRAPDPRLQVIGHNAAEPTLGLTRDGEIFYTAFQTNTRIEVVRSADEGKTWDVVSPQFAGARNAQLVSFDPYLWVDPYTDRVFTIDLTVACSYLSFTDDDGETWTTNPLACGRPVNDHQTLFSGPHAITPAGIYPNVVYYCYNDIATSSCSKSYDGGVTFTPTGTAPFAGYQPGSDDGGVGGQDAPGFCGGLHAHGHVGADGTAYLPRGWCGEPWLAISRDEGTTWTQVQVANKSISGHEAGVATDHKGNIYYTWVGGDDRLPYLSVSRDGGETWSKPMMIGPPRLREANLPGIAVGDPGKLAIVYMGSENSPGAPFPEQSECTAIGACSAPDGYEDVTWNGYITISADVLTKDPLFYSASVNDPKEPLVRRNCGPGRCQAVYDFIDIVIGSDGTAWGAFVDSDRNAATLVANGLVGRLVGGPKLR